MIAVKKKILQAEDQYSWKSKRTPVKTLNSASSKNLLKENLDVNYLPDKSADSNRTDFSNNARKCHPGCPQQIMCKHHNHKPAAFEANINDSLEFYCEKCAVGLAAHGHRLIQLNSRLQNIKQKLESQLEKELAKLRNSYKFVISALQTELQNLQKLIVQKYEQAIELSGKVETCSLLSFKQGHISSVAFNKIKQLIGKLDIFQVKLESKPKQQTTVQGNRITRTESTLLTNTSSISGRTRLDSNRSIRPKPTQIFIQLCDDQVTFTRGQPRLSSNLRQVQNILL